MIPFRTYLSSFLSDDPKTSLYGMGVVSDHDVFHNMSTDRDMKSFLKGKKFDKENLEQLMLALGSKRKNMYEWFRRLAKSVVFNMQLPLTLLSDEEEEGPFIFQEAPDYKGGCQERVRQAARGVKETKTGRRRRCGTGVR
jgi:hypothetical protein